MLKGDIEQHLRNYDFLLSALDSMIDKTNGALKEDKRWFSFAPRVCKKFLNQAITLKSLFLNKTLEIGDKKPELFEDVSSTYATLRMQFETHALFYHLFMPCQNIEENILRFRLWELDGNLYSHFSMHIHSGYIGVVQSAGLNLNEQQISKYVSVLYSCFVTSFLIMGFSKRFKESKEQYDLLNDNGKELIQSFIKAGRN